MAEIRLCETDADYAAALRVTKDYLRWLALDLSFQSLDAEFAAFPVMYGPPDGAFLLALDAGEPAGGVGLRRLEPGICEMKRLYVYEASQGRGLGRALYAGLGFAPCAPYRYNPDPGAAYLELRLE